MQHIPDRIRKNIPTKSPKTVSAATSALTTHARGMRFSSSRVPCKHRNLRAKCPATQTLSTEKVTVKDTHPPAFDVRLATSILPAGESVSGLCPSPVLTASPLGIEQLARPGLKRSPGPDENLASGHVFAKSESLAKIN